MKLTIDTEDAEIKWILGLPSFRTGPIAHVLRAGGASIPTHFEEEQAAAFIWMIELYHKHGADWKKKGDEELDAIKQAMKHPELTTESTKSTEAA